MNGRIEELVSVIPYTNTFADVGCDHGYVAEAMLKSGKCKKAYVSDVSEKCLEKAKKLLAGFISAGSAEAVVSDGFEKLPLCDCALIAGMGGEEIIKIVSAAAERKVLPDKLVLQPMKNFDRVRDCCVKNGYRIKKDYVFYVKDKYYFIIATERGKDFLSEEEREFGRTNISERPSDFVRYAREEKEKLAQILDSGNLCDSERDRIIEKIKRLNEYAKS